MKKRKDGRYQKKITAEKNGKVYTKWVYGRTIAELNRKEQEFHVEVENKDKPIFFDMRDQYLDHVKKTKAMNTYLLRLSSMKWWSNYFGNLRVDEITPLMIMDGLNQMQKAGNSRATASLKLTALRQMFAYGNVLYQNFPDPTRGVEVPTTMPPLNKIESPPREVLQYVNDHVDDTFGFMPYLILYTGLRRGEALGLRYEDCYDDVIHVSRTIVFESADSVNGMTEVEDHTKTAAGMREVPIFPQVAPYLSQKKSGYIIGGKEMPITRSEFNDGWHRYQRRCADACGGYHLRTHQLRHAFATACYNNGIDAKVCASWMGHKSIATTLNIYTTLGKEKQMEQAKKMKDFF